MPIYEYLCAGCAGTFEELVRGDEPVACPDCGGTTVTKLLSSFATPRPVMAGGGGGGGGGCCGGSCGCGH